MNKYAKGQTTIDGVIIVDVDKDWNDNPLFYVWREYPVYSKIENSRLRFAYEFYTDNSGNRYLVITDYDINKDYIPALLKEKNEKDKDWGFARNVDEFVEGADKDSYARWLDLIS